MEIFDMEYDRKRGFFFFSGRVESLLDEAVIEQFLNQYLISQKLKITELLKNNTGNMPMIRGFKDTLTLNHSLFFQKEELEEEVIIALQLLRMTLLINNHLTLEENLEIFKNNIPNFIIINIDKEKEEYNFAYWNKDLSLITFGNIILKI